MFQRQTTIIVGAGCSAEYKMPVGDGLKDAIADQLEQIGRRKRENGFITVTSQGADDTLVGAITYEGQKFGDRNWVQIANGMAEGIRHAPSIDRYLHIHRDNPAKVKIGKLAIAWAILAAEERSLLATGVNLAGISRSNNGEPHWLQQLFNRLQADVPLGEIERAFDKLTIITFNYDRLIEHYLFHAVKALGGFDEKQAAAALSHLKIVHPYGKIGRLPWQPDDGGPSLAFGRNEYLQPQTLMDSAERLRTFTETVEEEDLIGAIYDGILNPSQIIILGFSYLRQNLELMTSQGTSKVMNVEATCYLESDSNRLMADKGIRQMLRGNAISEMGDFGTRWHNTTAGAFIRDFGNEIAS